MKKTLLVLLTVIMLFSTAAFTVGASNFGSGVMVIADDVTLIKTGLVGQKLTFSDTDFKTALGVSEFNKVTITKLPSEEDGTLMLGGRKLGEGQVIRRRNVASLIFIPKNRDVKEASFRFTVDDYAGGAVITATLKFIEKVNYAPTVGSATEEALCYTTQREISLFGEMSATDKEGDELEYIIVSYPESGTLTVSNKNSGDFRYTPNEGYSGKDKFIYVVRDEYGNFSKPATVNLKVTERISEVVYVDMIDTPEYNAAVALTGMGIMSGKRIGDNMYFMKDETVTRAEFVAMAMKAVGLSANPGITESFFDDNDLIPAPLMGYVATAQRRGIINGAFDGKALNFRPNDAITKYEAGIIMANLIDLGEAKVSVEIEGMNTIPVFAREQYSALCAIGIFDADTEGAKDAVKRSEASEYIYRLSQYRSK